MCRTTRTLSLGLAALALSITVGIRAADTVENALTLHNLGVSDEVLIAWAQQQPPIEASSQNLAQLKLAQLSSPVVQALLSGNTKPKNQAAPLAADDTEIRAAPNAMPPPNAAPPPNIVPPFNNAPTVVIDGNNVYNFDPCGTAVIGWANVYNYYPQAGYGFAYPLGWRSLLNVDLFPPVVTPSGNHDHNRDWDRDHDRNRFGGGNSDYNRDGDFHRTNPRTPNYGYRSGASVNSPTPARPVENPAQRSPAYVTQRPTPAPVQNIQSGQSSPPYVTQRPAPAPAPVFSSPTAPSPTFSLPPTATPAYRR